MTKECVCGVEIADNRTICKECAETYGINSSEWPEWFRWTFNDLRREHLSSISHDSLRLDDIEPNGNGRYRPKRELSLRGCRIETHLYEDRNKY